MESQRELTSSLSNESESDSENEQEEFEDVRKL